MGRKSTLNFIFKKKFKMGGGIDLVTKKEKINTVKKKPTKTKKEKTTKKSKETKNVPLTEKKVRTKKETTQKEEQKTTPTQQEQNTQTKTTCENTHQPEINIGLIGHVDHGKTSLTKTLTGKWCDSHSEVLKRGISIRLGYADATFYKIKSPSGIIYSNKKETELGEIIGQRTISIVDAPGHETLMTTMLSGAALMNGAILVIAANEKCPQPRTIEHLMALKFAGVENCGSTKQSGFNNTRTSNRKLQINKKFFKKLRIRKRPNNTSISKL